MVHCSASGPAVSAVYWIMETTQCPLPPLSRGSQCLLSINWNVRGLTKTTSNECQQLLQVASKHAALTAACSAAALQHCLQAMWKFEEQSICLVSAHLHFCTNYALTMNTMHWLCICTLSTNTAALQTWRCPTSGEIRRLIPVSTNHQPRLSDMQPGFDKCSDNSAIQRGKYGWVWLCLLEL